MITIEELESIVKKYSLANSICSLEQITDGWTNLTYKFQISSSNDFYILREYIRHEQHSNNIQFELDFISYLFHQYHLPVVPAIHPPGLLILSNEHNAAIFQFIHGRKYLISQRELWQIIEISRFLGRLHSIDQKDFSTRFNRRTINFLDVKYQLTYSCAKFERDCPDYYQRIRRILDKKTQMIPLTNNQVEQIQFEQDFERNLPKGVIHMDVHDENVLFHSELQQIAAVLDFDDMSYGPFLLDIAMTLCFWCSIDSKFNFEYAKIFLNEYEKAREKPLTTDEWNHLELYCYLTFFHQLLFSIQSREHREVTSDMLDELLLPIEQIFQNESNPFLFK